MKAKKTIFSILGYLLILNAGSANAFPEIVQGSKVAQSGLPPTEVFSVMITMNQISEQSGIGNIWDDAILHVSPNLTYGLAETTLRAFDLTTKKYLGGWPLTRWTHESIEKEVLDRFDLVRRSYQTRFSLHADHPLGCLNKAPLRYGDIESDSKNELVLFIGNDLMVFSPDYQRVVFAVRLDIEDWFNEAETARYFEFNTYEAGRAVKPQYQSATNVDYSEAIPGYRGYAKIYIGDFDEDGSADILVWRKLYLSNMTDNPQKGFTKQEGSYYHFERDLVAQEKLPAGTTGEYLPQPTEPVQIQSWLTDNNLTWQKGYPSQSECAGQEGQLIPEMHNPLLNDADVLE